MSFIQRDIESRVFIDASMIMSVHIFVSEHMNVHICVSLCVYMYPGVWYVVSM